MRNLRAKTQDLFSQLLSQPTPQPTVEVERQEYSIAKRQSVLVRDNDEDKSYVEPRSNELLISKETKDNSVIYRSFTASKLPRHKTELSYEERERILAQR